MYQIGEPRRHNDTSETKDRVAFRSREDQTQTVLGRALAQQNVPTYPL